MAVDVKNTGAVPSDEVVQLYVTTPHSSVPAPKLRLADFARVHIRAGAVVTVRLSVAPKAHSVVMEDVAGFEVEKFWSPTVTVEAGDFSVNVGGGQPNTGVQVLEAAVNAQSAGLLSDCDVSSGV